MPSAACTNEVFADKDERDRARAMKIDVFFN
jgi:hypothetical protein